MNCKLCQKPIEPSTRAVSLVGGMFPREEPDLFSVDEEILSETYVHLDCLNNLIRDGKHG